MSIDRNLAFIRAVYVSRGLIIFETHLLSITDKNSRVLTDSAFIHFMDLGSTQAHLVSAQAHLGSTKAHLGLEQEKVKMSDAILGSNTGLLKLPFAQN